MIPAWSVGGIHPTEHELAYAAYACFASQPDAEKFQRASWRVAGQRWYLTDVIYTPVAKLPSLPSVDEFIARCLATL
jgi:hypothetical protein